MSFDKLGLLPLDHTLAFCCFYTEHSPQHFTHTHLLTVSNTVGSVSSLVELAAKPQNSSCCTALSSDSRQYRLPPCCPLLHNRELSFFIFTFCSVCFFFLPFSLRCAVSDLDVSLFAACLYETDKVTHRGLSHSQPVARSPPVRLSAFYRASLVIYKARYWYICVQ